MQRPPPCVSHAPMVGAHLHSLSLTECVGVSRETPPSRAVGGAGPGSLQRIQHQRPPLRIVEPLRWPVPAAAARTFGCKAKCALMSWARAGACRSASPVWRRSVPCVACIAIVRLLQRCGRNPSSVVVRHHARQRLPDAGPPDPFHVKRSEARAPDRAKAAVVASPPVCRSACPRAAWVARLGLRSHSAPGRHHRFTNHRCVVPIRLPVPVRDARFVTRGHRRPVRTAARAGAQMSASVRSAAADANLAVHPREVRAPQTIDARRLGARVFHVKRPRLDVGTHRHRIVVDRAGREPRTSVHTTLYAAVGV